MTVTHDTVRSTLADGHTSPEVAEHLAACPSCQSFAAALDHVVALAPNLATPSAEGLSDRVLDRLDLDAVASAGRAATSTTTSTAGTVVALRRRPWDGALRRVTAVAAALMLVAGAVSVGLRTTREDDPRAIVLASAERTTAEGSAEVQVDADAEVVVAVPDAPPGTRPSDPDFSGVPAELQLHVHAQWEATITEFERQLAQFEADVDAAMRDYERLLQEWQRQLDEAMRQLAEAFTGGSSEPSDDPTFEMPAMPGMPLPPGAPAAPAEPSPAPPPAAPTSVSARVDVQARGVVAFGDGLRLDGTAAPVGQVTVGDTASFGLRVAGDSAVYLGPDGTWTELAGTAGPLAGVILDPAAVSRVLAAAGEDVAFEGEVMGDDGTPLRRYRFTVRGDTLLGGMSDASPTSGATTGGEPWTAEAWIDAEGRTRRLQVATDAAIDTAGTTWRTRVDLRLSAFGTDTGDDPLPTPRARMQVPARSSLLIYPFGANVSATTKATVEVDR